jgi:1-deoxy-D-xylulose-5-phosphate synthase
MDCLRAAEILATHGVRATVADARFAKPLDTALVKRLARHHPLLVTVEQGSVGGFSAQVLTHLARAGLHRPVLPLTLPDAFVEHGTPAEQAEACGMTAQQMADTIRKRLG